MIESLYDIIPIDLYQELHLLRNAFVFILFVT